MEEYGVTETKEEPEDLEELKGYDKQWIGNPAKGIKAKIKQKEKEIDKLYDQLKGV